MMEFEWNQLVAEDRVVIHAHGEGANRTTVGTVISVTAQSGHNEVGVRADGNTEATLLWPTRFEMHSMTDAATSVCPWCASAGFPTGTTHASTLLRPSVSADGRR